MAYLQAINPEHQRLELFLSYMDVVHMVLRHSILSIQKSIRYLVIFLLYKSEVCGHSHRVSPGQSFLSLDHAICMTWKWEVGTLSR